MLRGAQARGFPLLQGTATAGTPANGGDSPLDSFYTSTPHDTTRVHSTPHHTTKDAKSRPFDPQKQASRVECCQKSHFRAFSTRHKKKLKKPSKNVPKGPQGPPNDAPRPGLHAPFLTIMATLWPRCVSKAPRESLQAPQELSKTSPRAPQAPL